MIITVIKEYGLSWAICRGLYSAKLIMHRKLPKTEQLFEKNVAIKKCDIINPDIERIKSILKKLPDDKKTELINIADNACRGIIRGFSSIDMDYKNPINWQLNPITQKECDITKKWYKIPDFDKERGDIKAIWEISRFSHFVTLARAYLLTEDEKYYKAFKNQLSDWLLKNPYSYGANYKCGQECALRMMNVLLAYSVFKNSGLIDEEDTDNVKELLKRCYKKILSNFFYAYRCIKNNHTISELAGMIIGAWSCENERRMKKAYKLLDKVIKEQFLKDGGYRQYAFNYQRLALQDLEYVLSLQKSTGLTLSQKSLEIIKKSALLLYQCQDENGDVANYGSNDGALIFPVTSCSYRDFRPIINSIYAKICKKRLYPEGIYDEECAWFLDDDLDKLPPSQMKKKPSAFSKTGLFTMRDEKTWLLTVMNKFTTRPAHMDQLHIDLWIEGVNVFCDSGTYSYSDDEGKALSLTGAHNTVKLKDKEQMSKRGEFMIYNRTESEVIKSSETEFLGEVKSKNGYTHQRGISKTEAGYTVTDRVMAGENAEFEILFHTPCKAEVSDGKICIFEGEKQICSIETSQQIEITTANRSLFYLVKEPILKISLLGKCKNGYAECITKINITKGE